jgi:hypothetical protein
MSIIDPYFCGGGEVLVVTEWLAGLDIRM